MTYGLVAIVKDERPIIDRFLDSALAVCAHATIVDTGSTDDTVATIEARGIEVHHRPFDNFGASRSASLELARGTADWLLALDADCTVEIDPAFEPDPAADAYLVEVGTEAFSYRLPALLNGRREWKSVGAVHEYTALADGTLGVRVPTDAVRITHHGQGRSSPDKSRWHLELLEDERRREPANPRTIFYMAQTYADLGDLVNAQRFYDYRSRMTGFDEETYVAAYRAAQLMDWPERRDRLWSAWVLRPDRLEAAYALARGLNEHDDHSMAYAVASVPSGAPSKDILFVEPAAWQYGITFERHVAAWWIGRYAESQSLGRALLEEPLPDDIRAAVERNLAFGPREG